MRNVLDALREALLRKEKVKLLAEHLVIGGERIPRKTSTSFRSDRGAGPLYALDAVYFQYLHRDKGYRELVPLCKNEGVDRIRLLDKKPLLEYLDGNITSCPNIRNDAAGDKTSVRDDARATTGQEKNDAEGEKVIGEKENGTLSSKPEMTALDAKEDKDVQSGTLYERVCAVERQQRTRDSVMAVVGRDFTWLRMKLEQHIRDKKTNTKKKVHSISGSGRDHASAAFDPRGDRYKVKHDRVWRENMGADFGELGINPGGSFIKPQPTNGAKSSSAPALDHRRPVSARPTISHGKRPAPPDPSALLPRKHRKVVSLDRRPIIIAPPPSRGVIVNAANLPQLIMKSEFYSIEAMKAAGMRAAAKPVVFTKRDPGGNSRGIPAEYVIASNVSRMEDGDWKRVVAVICSGQEWQFKNWPFRGSLPEIFTNIQGFYFHYDDEQPNPKVKDWAVKKLMLSRNRRHMDSRVMTEFWNTIDKYIGSKKPFLHY